MPPITMLIKPASGLCNMKCKYCFYADVASNRQTKSYGLMSPKTQEAIVKSAFMNADKFCSFAFQGGEPTLAGLEFYENHIRLIKKYNTKNIPFSNSIQTNGLLIDDKMSKFFAENKFLVGLSLDGDKNTNDSFRVDSSNSGTFNRIMSASRLLKKHGAEFNILCVVNNYVARHGLKVYNFFKRNGFNFLQFIPCIDAFNDDLQHDYSLSPSRYGEFLCQTFSQYYHDFKSGSYVSVRNFDNYINMLAHIPPESCGMSGICNAYLTIEGDGSVFPCDFYVLDKYKMGNINEHSIDSMLFSIQATEFADESKYIDKACKECKFFFICRGGCRRYREPFISGKPSLNRFCASYKQFFDSSIDKMQEMADSIRGNMRT